MNGFNFIQWLAIVGPLATLTSAMFYLSRDDMKQLAAQHKEDTKNLFSLWKENQERWVATQLEIKDILQRMDRKER